MTMSRFGRVLLAVSATTLATAAAVAAKPYPTNTCVSRKQDSAGDYCKRVLKAWAKWDRTGNASGRDAKIAETKSLKEAPWRPRSHREAGSEVRPHAARRHGQEVRQAPRPRERLAAQPGK